MVFEVSLLAVYLSVAGLYLGYLRHLGIKVSNSHSNLSNKLEREFRQLERQVLALSKTVDSDQGLAVQPVISTLTSEMSVLTRLIGQLKHHEIPNSLILIEVAIEHLCSAQKNYQVQVSIIKQTIYVMQAVVRTINAKHHLCVVTPYATWPKPESLNGHKEHYKASNQVNQRLAAQ